jgi:long-chain fatty acid transport protein
MKFITGMTACAIAAACAVFSGGAAASGFALLESGASGRGNSYAGGAAIADDVSTIFSNPAGMANMSGTQIAVTLHALQPSAKFSGTMNGAAPLQPSLGGTGGDAGGLNWVPNAAFVMEINPRMRFGLSVDVPFGLKTDYDPNWMGRFQAIKSQLKTINLNPALSWQLNDTVAIGAGLSYQHINGELSSAVNYSAAAFSAGGAPLLGAIGGPGVEGVSTITGSDNAWGYNFGALFKLSPQTRIGLAYRSTIKYKLSGTVTFTSVPAALAAGFANGPVSLAIKMPDNFSASAFHQLNGKWDVMADATWTGWSVLQQLKIDRANGTNLTTVPENWRDTWRVAVGANYHYSAQWLSRIGVAYEQTPVPDAFRTARIPDANRYELSLGGQYKPTKDSAWDFAYAHLFMQGAPVNQNAANNTDLTASGAGYLLGSYNDTANVLSVQYTHNL